MSDRHRFRFFVDATGAPGACLPLAAIDAHHARVLRLADGHGVDVVDAEGTLWEAQVAGASVQLVASLDGSTEPAPIELYAGALTGAKFDELVDGAVQAGASLVVPFASNRRDLERLGARRARLERLARAAAKQSKRVLVPTIGAPIGVEELPDRGIVLDSSAPEALDRVVARSGLQPLRLLVGGADGIDHAVIAALVERGWTRARLGPTILRAELAAAVAVAVAAMHMSHSAIGVAGD